MKLSIKPLVAAVVALALIIVLAASSTALAVEPYGPTYEGDLTLVVPSGGTPGSGPTGKGGSPGGAIAPGATIKVSGGGFAPHAKYDILWDGKVYIDPYADANGNVSYEFAIPATASNGIHTVALQGAAAAGGTLVLSANIVVRGEKVAAPAAGGTEKSAATYPFTGGGALTYALIAGIVLVASGLGVKLLRRAR